MPRTTVPTALVPGGRVVQNLVQILLIRRALASGIRYQFHLLNMVALLKLCVECPIQLRLPVTKSTLFMRTLPPQTEVLLENLEGAELGDLCRAHLQVTCHLHILHQHVSPLSDSVEAHPNWRPPPFRPLAFPQQAGMPILEPRYT
jgi:hypothetical protein